MLKSVKKKVTIQSNAADVHVIDDTVCILFIRDTHRRSHTTVMVPADRFNAYVCGRSIDHVIWLVEPTLEQKLIVTAQLSR